MSIKQTVALPVEHMDKEVTHRYKVWEAFTPTMQPDGVRVTILDVQGRNVVQMPKKFSDAAEAWAHIRTLEIEAPQL
jgi:hypothetical protein